MKSALFALIATFLSLAIAGTITVAFVTVGRVNRYLQPINLDTFDDQFNRCIMRNKELDPLTTPVVVDGCKDTAITLSLERKK